jgi:hypothetical protein
MSAAGEPKRVSRKGHYSCDFCRARKLRCNRPLPCNNCVSRGKKCDFAIPSRQNGSPPGFAAETARPAPQEAAQTSAGGADSAQRALLAEIQALKKYANELEARVVGAARQPSIPSPIPNSESGSAQFGADPSSTCPINSVNDMVAQLERVSMGPNSDVCCCLVPQP